MKEKYEITVENNDSKKLIMLSHQLSTRLKSC